METEERPDNAGAKTIPFNNLYLISGLVHGYNKLSFYVITVLLFVVGYLSYQLVALFPLMQRLKANGYSESEIIARPNLVFNSVALQMDRNLVLAIELGMFVFAFAGFYIGVRWLHHKPFVSLVTGFEKFRFKRFWFSFAVWGGLILAFTLISWFSGDASMHMVFEPRGFIVSLLLLCCVMPIQVGIEELIFRGYLVQGLALVFRNGIVPLVITTLLFGIAHMGNPEVQKHGWEIMLPYYLLNALLFGVLTLLDEGLELAYGMHLSNNIISGLLVTSPNSVIQPYTIFMVENEEPKAEILGWLVMAAIAFVIFYMRYRWKNFRLIIK